MTRKQWLTTRAGHVIVNIESILHLEPISHGEFEVILKGGSRLRISRTYRAQLEKRLGQSL